ncbi:MAG TPA: ATP synthase F1 subunit delta [Candidatus Binataceae bacterium]|jgi:F-type H+-transporting ATPase subunit delta|nr:ATP synthase F1 subunit delta [Candidatus Binataceae bacterium]
MKSSKVARRYARALLGLSSDQRQLETWGAEIEKLAQIVESPEILRSMMSPEVAPAAKMRALSIIVERLGLSYPVRSFAAVVARHGRIEDLPAIAEAYRRMLDDLMGRTRAVITFAQPPGDGDLQRVIEGLGRIANKQIIPTVRVNPALIGGVVVELEAKTYDGSLARRLAEAARLLSS